MQKQQGVPIFAHVVLQCFDLERMSKFYSSMFAMKATDRGVLGRSGVPVTFLSSTNEHHHQMVLVSGRECTESPILHSGFRLGSLEGLKKLHSKLERGNIEGIRLVNHGIMWSVYFLDPDGNEVEAYVDTPYYVPQPARGPLDLSLTEQELVEETKQLFGDLEGFVSREKWESSFSN